jgi:AAA+ ATPase superfamily predicted ATPase
MWYFYVDFSKYILVMEKIIIGRGPEKAKLDQLLQSNEAEFLALYGRRRVGKTFLIRQYLKDHLVFDLSGSKDGGT